ncbi:MAG: hypothetical protein A3H96_09775 [Acidobacteria bacterium RIFCSPLOWO2_02_FULL_67_36]|nr:MAG: hypothetical protein A3H96_09775 [Acidobacteria bacterium RIFCSPLOWO2_02_FULL_67_36]OFW24943.1 MAG: hypothetical protein A3G21_15965 [Acidobacteria bacterium RIFCSPLOWO2_12_FULL_66_21]
MRRSRLAPARPDRRRRILNAILVFAAVVLMADALVGDKGFLETLRARRQYRDIAGSVDALRRDNARLREEVRRLNEDPSAIEAIARQDLGLIRPGEVVFIIKDVKGSNLNGIR